MPGAGGYRVRETPQPEAVAVYEADGGALRACAATLEAAGWQAGEYTEPRTRARYLLASRAAHEGTCQDRCSTQRTEQA